MAFGGYTKLSSSILASTVWREPNETRIVWITMLALANAQGVVEASIPGLADLARVPLLACEDALLALQRPDPYSRTKEHEGRRIEPVDGGWLLLNYDRHRERVNVDERREYLRLAKQRSRQRASEVNGGQQTSTKSTQAEAEAEAEAEASCSSSKSAIGGGAPPAVDAARPKRRKYECATHRGHVSGFCDWICFPVRLRQQFAAASGEDISTTEKRAEIEDRVVLWAKEVRIKWEGRQIGDGMWDFWKLRWREDFGTTDQREAWRARSIYPREMR